MVKDRHQYKKFMVWNLPTRNPWTPDIPIDFELGVLELHFDGPATFVLQEAKRQIEEEIELSKTHPEMVIS